jgi:ADP-ribose pyrophosphatase YjhB (NUDIX family)
VSDRPVVTVGAIIERPDGKILLVRTHKWRDRLGLPGGKVERGERLEDALRRELFEETSLVVRDARFVLVQESIDSPEFHRPAHMVLLNYHCVTEDGSAVQLNDEAEDFVWCAPSEALALGLNAPTRTLIESWLAQST